MFEPQMRRNETIVAGRCGVVGRFMGALAAAAVSVSAKPISALP
jgi:hypothetical protein